jgi:hypothetical protein
MNPVRESVFCERVFEGFCFYLFVGCLLEFAYGEKLVKIYRGLTAPDFVHQF